MLVRMAIKDYDAIINARRTEQGEPFQFKLNGRIFTALPEIQVTSLAALTEDGLDSTIEFIAQALVPDDRAAFRELASGTQRVEGSKKTNDVFIFSPKTLEGITADLTSAFAGNGLGEKSSA